MDSYVLIDKEPVRITDQEMMLNFQESSERLLAQEDVTIHWLLPKIFVSTVFLCFDHRLSYDGSVGKPVLFETMIFGGPNNDYQERYCTYDEAMVGHQKALALAKVPLAEYFDWLLRSLPERIKSQWWHFKIIWVPSRWNWYSKKLAEYTAANRKMITDWLGTNKKT